MLDRRRHIQRARPTRGLHPLDVCRTHGRRQRGLLAPCLVRPAPPVVAGQILDRCEDPVPAGRADRVRGHSAAGTRGRRVPRCAHPDRLREQRRLPRMAEAVHRVHPEEQRDVQPRVLDRVLLDHVVLVRPVVAGVPGATLAGRVRRVVRAAGEQRARVIVDQPRLQAALVQLGPAPAAARAGRAGHVVDQLLIHLADLLRQRHCVQEGVHPGVDRLVGIKPRCLRGVGGIGKALG